MKLTTIFLVAFAQFALAGTITITDSSGNAVANAEILIGYAAEEPFSGNMLAADENGIADIPAEWTNPQPVTVNAPGFIRRTFYGQMPESRTFKMERRELEDRIELNGSTSGFGRLRQDGFVNFGMVIPGMTRADLVTFDLGKVISPETDSISIVGQQIDMPSNLTLPRQRESYIFPITFNKPRYRSYFSYPGKTQVFTLHGKFELQKVAGKLRSGEPFVNVINDVEFISGSQREIELTEGSSLTETLPVNDVTFGNKVRVTAPGFGRQNIMIGVTLADVDGFLFPSDLKTFERNQSLQLKTASVGEKYILKVVQPKYLLTDEANRNEDRPLTVTFDRQNSRTERTFVNFVDQPQVQGDSLVLDAPSAKGATTPVGTIATLSDIEVRENGDLKVELKRRSWEFFSKDWQSEMKIPTWPGSMSQQRGLRRLEIMYLGGDTANVENGPNMIQNTTHVIYNKKDL